MFGGSDAGRRPVAETWEYDGANWRQVNTIAPSAQPTSLAFDILRGRTVLFGIDGSNSLAETWEYDGSTWTQVSPATSPAPGGTMAFDVVRGRTVLLGSNSGTPLLTFLTWEYDGATWTQVITPAPTPWRFGYALAFDFARGRTLMFGGTDSFFAMFADTWEYDGSTWTMVSPAASPPALYGHAMVYDFARGRTVLFGGAGAHGLLADTWEYDGATWTQVNPPTSPTARWDHAMVYDFARGRTIVFGGVDANGQLYDTWEYDGATWARMSPVSSPSQRWGHAMDYDLTRRRAVLFGGDSGYPPHTSLGTSLGDTWEYDGASWTLMSPATSPPARYAHAMVYDRVRGSTVLFGGALGWNSPSADTWEYDGMTWTQMNPAAAPSARSQHAMAYDLARGRTVLFGGWDAQVQLSDTWEYDGATWTQMSPATSPPARSLHAMVYDIGRGSTVLFGGSDLVHYWVPNYADTWEYDGSDWRQLSLPVSPMPRSGHAMAYDLARGRTLLFGGGDSNGELADTWELIPAATPTLTRHGVGCLGSAGTPSLDALANTLPGLGSVFPLQLTALPAQPGFAYIAFGFDLIRWNGALLPVSLTPFGLPGCQLWIAPTVGALLATQYGTAAFALTIPNNPALAGVTVGAQALSFDVATPSGFGAVSNGVILRVY
jgi:hypothetical protein